MVPSSQLHLYLWSLPHSYNSVCGHSLTVTTPFVVSPSQLYLHFGSLPLSYNSIYGPFLTVIPPFVLPHSYTSIYGPSLTVTTPINFVVLPLQLHLHLWSLPLLQLHFWPQSSQLQLHLWSLAHSYNSISGPNPPNSTSICGPSLTVTSQFMVHPQLHLNWWFLSYYILICVPSHTVTSRFVVLTS